MTVRIVTDSASDLTAAEAEELDVSIVPLTIRFGDEEYVDRRDLTVADFYAKMASSEVLPETAAPSPGAFDQIFRECAASGAEAVVCINMSLSLSATGQAAQAAARDVADVIPVMCLDSRSVTAGLGTQVLRAARAAAAGASADEIVELVGSLVPRTRVYGVLDTLENLQKGGRIGGARAMLGTMLAIKPCVDLSSGEVVEAGRQRTRKKAMGWLKSVLADAGAVEDLAVIHGNAPDVDEFVESLSDVVDVSELRVSTLGAVIGTHAGPRVLGVTYLTPD